MNTLYINVLATTAIWNSLEIAKLLVSAIVPIIIAYVGYIIRQRLKKIEAIQSSNMVLLEWRMRIYEKMTPLLNDIYCYLTYVGDWKTMTPEQILKSKRLLDKEFYMVQPLFSQELSDAYDQFIKLCFQTYTGQGQDAKIRSGYERDGKGRKIYMGDSWETRYEDMFVKVPEATTEEEKERDKRERKEHRDKIRNSYGELMRRLTCELGFFLSHGNTR